MYRSLVSTLTVVDFDYSGYPSTDVDALRQIHPDLLSFEDWFKKNAPK